MSSSSRQLSELLQQLQQKIKVPENPGPTPYTPYRIEDAVAREMMSENKIYELSPSPYLTMIYKLLLADIFADPRVQCPLSFKAHWFLITQSGEVFREQRDRRRGNRRKELSRLKTDEQQMALWAVHRAEDAKQLIAPAAQRCIEFIHKETATTADARTDLLLNHAVVEDDILNVGAGVSVEEAIMEETTPAFTSTGTVFATQVANSSQPSESTLSLDGLAATLPSTSSSSSSSLFGPSPAPHQHVPYAQAKAYLSNKFYTQSFQPLEKEVSVLKGRIAYLENLVRIAQGEPDSDSQEFKEILQKVRVQFQREGDGERTMEKRHKQFLALKAKAITTQQDMCNKRVELVTLRIKGTILAAQVQEDLKTLRRRKKAALLEVQRKKLELMRKAKERGRRLQEQAKKEKDKMNQLNALGSASSASSSSFKVGKAYSEQEAEEATAEEIAEEEAESERLALEEEELMEESAIDLENSGEEGEEEVDIFDM
jgi:hypothetical protein